MVRRPTQIVAVRPFYRLFSLINWCIKHRGGDPLHLYKYGPIDMESLRHVIYGQLKWRVVGR